MKKIVTCIFLLAGVFASKAEHITGGEMYYTLIGFADGEYNYHVTCKLFKDCFVNRQFPDPAIIGIFHKQSGVLVSNINVSMSNTTTLDLENGGGPCISDPPQVCYNVAYYDFEVSLPPSPDGYTITIQVVYRINSISNLIVGYGNVGATYVGDIPGDGLVADAPHNNSAQFTGSDLVIVCANSPFTYSFAAKDADGDKLRYHFCEAYQGGTGNAATSFPPAPPPYESVPYGGIYSGSSPLGPDVQIDPITGLIKGNAPDAGTYVVTVCVDEIRKGVVIATQRKDFQIKIAACTIAAAKLPPSYSVCHDTKTVSLMNLILSPLIDTYSWEISNVNGQIIGTSNTQFPTFTFPDTGTYKIKLLINKDEQCTDSASTFARVYPGFKPGFTFNGICFGKPTDFADASTSFYGVSNTWYWAFGEPTVYDDSSHLKFPTYTYPTMGTKSIMLIVGDSKGCIDTAYKDITILDKPPITLSFKDTLICIPDKVQLQASGEGDFNWTPGINIVNPNSPTPTVAPTSTTTYYVGLDDNGCQNSDSVQVRVVDHVNLQAMKDTTICSGDTILTHLVSNGLHYSWTPAAQFVNPTLASALAFTNTSLMMEVTAIIGSCSAKDQVLVSAVPYPTANAGTDTLICYNTSAQLHAFTNGSTYSWQPDPTLDNSSLLNPVARPRSNHTYIFYAYDTRGCPKPGIDTVLVSTLPPIRPTIGDDTAVVVGQPLQLQAGGGVKYEWLPGTGLSSTNIPNPVGIYYEPSTGIAYEVLVFNEAGCVDSAFEKVKVYQAKPTVFVPNAFSPNGDNKNEVLRPIAAGIKQIEYFNVYNRWGQMVFHSVGEGQGWNGTLSGRPQATDTYVWVLKAVDYTGATIVEKGTVVLIR
jgi:gliding motility-associated-like protein